MSIKCWDLEELLISFSGVYLWGVKSFTQALTEGQAAGIILKIQYVL